MAKHELIIHDGTEVEDAISPPINDEKDDNDNDPL